MKFLIILLLFFQVTILNSSYAQVKDSRLKMGELSPISSMYISPTGIIWQNGAVKNTAQLLTHGIGQATLVNQNICILKNNKESKASILLDFGKELHGGLEIVTGRWKGNSPVKVRIRFGESVSETMSSLGEKGSSNDHAIRDIVTNLPWLGKLELGNTGFRFVKIDLLDEDTELHLKEVRAIFKFRDIPYLGSFKSSDTLLNKVWDVGAYTVHLNMQEYLWDGIKRDRLVWVGDLHPEVATLNTVFGYNEVVPKSLDLIRDITPMPNWMNGISTYSMWWIIIHKDWYMHHGNINYLKEQQDYLTQLLNHLMLQIDDKNREKLNGVRFLDWPSSENPKGVHAGLQAMLIMSLNAGTELSDILKDKTTAIKCREAIMRLKQHIPDPNQSKQAASLMALTGLMAAEKANKEVIAVGGAKDFSTFYGYYMLKAKAMAGDYKGAIHNIREYWGGMLALGATTFWEDFNLDWMSSASRIDQLVPKGKKDIHSDYGSYSYKGYRHSLCHGWASGPTAWLTEYVLGIKVTKPGSREITIKPNLADLNFAEGTFPTPFGTLWVKHVKREDGTIKTKIKAPKGVRIIRE